MKTLYTLFTSLILLSSIGNSWADATSAEDMIAKSIKDSGGINDVNDDLRIDVVKGKAQLEQINTSNQLANVIVTKVDFDMSSNSFTAFLSVNNNLPIETNGTFTETTKLPVLTRKFAKDEVIGKDDIALLDVETSKIKGSFITDGSIMIGKSPTHALFKGRPVQISELTQPVAVTKNRTITLSYNNAALKIQANGVALENGAIGQTIKFKNESSGRIVVAKIVDSGSAEVQAADNVLASN